jgi:hypothetical protein
LNGKDDGGSSNDMNTFEGRLLGDLEPTEAEALRDKIPAGADDFSIRVPRPEFKLPKASTAANQP